MKSLMQLFVESSNSSVLKVPNAEVIRSALDVVRKNNPSSLNKVKNWAATVNAMKSQYPSEITGNDFIKFLQNNTTNDMQSFVSGIKALKSPDVYPSLSVNIRSFVNDVDKFIQHYASQPTPEPKKTWQPLGFSNQMAILNQQNKDVNK